jgi:hypothetical protein
MKTKMKAMIFVLCAVLFAGCEQAENPTNELSPDAQEFLTANGIPVFTGPEGVPLNSGLSGDYVDEDGEHIYQRVFAVTDVQGDGSSEIVKNYFEDVAEILEEANENENDNHEDLSDLEDLEDAIKDGFVRVEWVINDVCIIIFFSDEEMEQGGSTVPANSLVITIGYYSAVHG